MTRAQVERAIRDQQPVKLALQDLGFDADFRHVTGKLVEVRGMEPDGKAVIVFRTVPFVVACKDLRARTWRPR